MPPPEKYGVTKEVLREMHHEQLKTPKEIAEHFGCSHSLILHKLKKFGIKKLPKNYRLQGKKFGKLYVEEFSHYDDERMAIWKAICDCGNVVYISSGRLRFNTQCLECGRSNQKTHGMSKSELYSIWAAIKTRCNNPNAINYSNYGGRGITYDPRWEQFDNFYYDMTEGFEPGLTIERIDNNKGYYKENCKWATTEEQNRNRNFNCYLTQNGKTQIVTDWAEELGIDRHKIYSLKTTHPDWSDKQILKKAIENNIKNPLYRRI